uniref:Uncharacterized protein n=1 Tax=Anguilla anguilla TaxID=7936 RepID=A0A0E9QUN5_ANGAN
MTWTENEAGPCQVNELAWELHLGSFYRYFTEGSYIYQHKTEAQWK